MNLPDSIFINGQSCPFLHQSLQDLLTTNGCDPAQAGIAVAVNAVVAPRNTWSQIQLRPGDRVEIIQAVAGG